ncbi:MAG: type II toxin-antitoxin system HicA family toxin [Acidobacteria bacterium]|nr:type II toxin-antitoxin system HicA family toxin [Acidobacteriota bacterium]
MSRLPSVSGRQCAAALAKAGFIFRRQKGSPMILRRDAPFAQVSVPDHRELDRGTLRAILKAAALTPDDFTRLL